METNESVVVVVKLTSAVAIANPSFTLPDMSEVWLTLSRDKKLLEKGSKSQLARIYNYLDSIRGLATQQDYLHPLEEIAKGSSLSVSVVRSLIARAVALLKENGVAIEVKHELSEYRDGEYHTAKRGGKILGVTLNPLKNASKDVMRSARLLKADPLALAATVGRVNE